MAPGAYPAARLLAPRVEALFARHFPPQQPGSADAPALAPDAAAVELIIDAAFWASLRREEMFLAEDLARPAAAGRDQPPDAVRDPASPPPRRRSRASRPPSSARASTSASGAFGTELCVWGTAREVPPLLLRARGRRPGRARRQAPARAAGASSSTWPCSRATRVKVIDERAASLPDCPPLLTALLGFGAPVSWVDPVNVLVQLAVSMRAHGRGGLLLIVPARLGRLAGVDCRADSLTRSRRRSPSSPSWFASRTTSGEHQAAGATASAGGRGDCGTHGGGRRHGPHRRIPTARVRRQDRAAPRHRRVERVTVTEPIEARVAAVVEPPQLGGTRHLSAAQFVHDQPRRPRPGRLPGRPLHRLRLVALRRHGARPQGGDAASLEAGARDKKQGARQGQGARGKKQGARDKRLRRTDLPCERVRR